MLDRQFFLFLSYYYSESISRPLYNVEGKNNNMAQLRFYRIFYTPCHLFPHMNILENLIYAPVKVRKMSPDLAKNNAYCSLKYIFVRKQKLRNKQ